MSNLAQPGFFDLNERAGKRTKMGNPLVARNAWIDWEAFRQDRNRLHVKERKSKVDAKPIDVVSMFKILVLQQLHNLSDEGIEYQIRDRLSFMRFLGLQLEDRVPDAKTAWLFRECMKEAELIDVLFARFAVQLASHGYRAREGQMIDATFIEIPRQRNSREDNAKIKAGETPEDGKTEKNKHNRRQKEVDARWTKKNDEKHYGYKSHINADAAHKLIQRWEVTHAAVHDSQVLDVLLDHGIDAEGNKRALFADSAYRSKEREQSLAEAGLTSRIHENGVRGTPLNEAQKQANRIKSRTRARVEHVFGSQAQMGGHIVRAIGKLPRRGQDWHDESGLQHAALGAAD